MDQKSLLRVGIIGCGRIGSLWDETISESEMKDLSPKTHALAYLQNDATTLSAVFDTDGARAAAAASKWKVNFHTDKISEFVQQDLDIISICTPPEGRLETLKILSDLKKDVTLLIEKPLAKDLEEAQKIKTVLKNFRRPAIINYSRRFAPGIQQLKSKIARGDWGTLQCGTGYYGNGFMNNGSHMLDLMIYLLGSPKSCTKQKTTKDDRMGDDQTLSAAIEFGGGSFLQLHGLNHQNFTMFELDLVFTKGRLRLTDRGMTIQSQTVVEDTEYEGFKILGTPVAESAYYEKCLQNAVAEAVNIHMGQLKSPSCSVDDAIQVIQLVEEARKGSI